MVGTSYLRKLTLLLLTLRLFAKSKKKTDASHKLNCLCFMYVLTELITVFFSGLFKIDVFASPLHAVNLLYFYLTINLNRRLML